MLVEAIGTALPPLSKCFLLTGNKKGGSAKAEVKSGWYGALHNGAAVFYNRGGAGVTGLMMETVSTPPTNSGLQTHLLFYTDPDRKEKSYKEKGRGWNSNKTREAEKSPCSYMPRERKRIREASGLLRATSE